MSDLDTSTSFLAHLPARSCQRYLSGITAESGFLTGESDQRCPDGVLHIYLRACTVLYGVTAVLYGVTAVLYGVGGVHLTASVVLCGFSECT